MQFRATYNMFVRQMMFSEKEDQFKTEVMELRSRLVNARDEVVRERHLSDIIAKRFALIAIQSIHNEKKERRKNKSTALTK